LNRLEISTINASPTQWLHVSFTRLKVIHVDEHKREFDRTVRDAHLQRVPETLAVRDSRQFIEIGKLLYPEQVLPASRKRRE
jgi:hypothetical protein